MLVSHPKGLILITVSKERGWEAGEQDVVGIVVVVVGKKGSSSGTRHPGRQSTDEWRKSEGRAKKDLRLRLMMLH